VRARCCTLHAAAAAAVRCCCVRPYRRLSANNHTWFVIEVACSTGGSGNAFGPNINHSIIEANMKALTAKSTMWPSSSSTAASLADLGYTEFGIDEGWELCNKSFSAPGGEQHDADGKPMTNTTRFPDLGALVSDGHARGLSMGWYLAGCACGERVELPRNYRGDITQLHELGFDAVKFGRLLPCHSSLATAEGRWVTVPDEILACAGGIRQLRRHEESNAVCRAHAVDGQELLWYVTQATIGVPVTHESLSKCHAHVTRRAVHAVESCHWGHCWDQNGDPDASGCPTQSWCPFNMFRTSGDVATAARSWLHNLQTTIQFRDADAPLSRPGCWACERRLSLMLLPLWASELS
jgi:hypothetical protein